MEANTAISIKGVIQDAKTSEFLVGCNIYLKSDRMNAIYSNEQGRFDLTALPKSAKQDTLTITHAGYERYNIPISLLKNSKIRVKLQKRKTDRAEKDFELVELALKGSQRSYGKLMARYRDSIFFMIQKMVNNRNDAEDLTIEAFGKAFHNLHKYSNDYAFSTWLYRIAINNCIDFIRRKKLETFSIDEPISNNNDDSGGSARDIKSGNLDPEEKYIREQRILLMRSVIEQLNPKYRRLIELRYLQERSYDEIATEMKIPLGTVKAQLFRAKELLSNIMKGAQDSY